MPILRPKKRGNARCGRCKKPRRNTLVPGSDCCCWSVSRQYTSNCPRLRFRLCISGCCKENMNHEYLPSPRISPCRLPGLRPIVFHNFGLAGPCIRCPRLIEEAVWWPESLLQLSPSCARAASVDELAGKGTITKEAAAIFRTLPKALRTCLSKCFPNADRGACLSAEVRFSERRRRLLRELVPSVHSRCRVTSTKSFSRWRWLCQQSGHKSTPHSANFWSSTRPCMCLRFSTH